MSTKKQPPIANDQEVIETLRRFMHGEEGGSILEQIKAAEQLGKLLDSKKPAAGKPAIRIIDDIPGKSR